MAKFGLKEFWLAGGGHQSSPTHRRRHKRKAKMDPEKSSLKIRSHNLNGFNSSREFIRRECEDLSFSILAMQEHWLRPSFRKQKGVNLLKTLHPDFDSFATSGMNDHLNQRILKVGHLAALVFYSKNIFLFVFVLW